MNPAPSAKPEVGRPRPILVWAAGIAILAVVGWIDYITGYEIHLPALYFAPVALLAWNVSLRAGLGMVILATITWYLADLGTGHPYHSWFAGYFNASMEMVACAVVAYTVARVRRELNVEKKLNAALSQALTEINRLEGLLPICAAYKKIRKEDNSWEQIEAFVSERTEARFSHSLCPDCATKLYPGISLEG